MKIHIKIPGGGEIGFERDKIDWFPFWMALFFAGSVGSLLWIIWVLR